MWKTFLTIILAFFSLVSPIYATANNKFGIHLVQKEDLDKAQELVNSGNGDWGYVTMVIQENDQNREKWQEIFDLLRQKHLIPLIRLATYLENDTWQKPNEEAISKWANFLETLNWPVKNRYLIIFNEPNHGKEWGGQVNPGEYAQILDKAMTVFKQKNQDFFLLNAGFDQAASNSWETQDELLFLQQMESEVPGIFNRLDGWASHAYPNHGFVGKPWETGRASVKGYDWELQVLRNLGLEKDLPVFISETGWPHNGKFYDEEITAEYIKLAFESVWLPDEKVKAVTPFILNYPFSPFAHFSWLDEQQHPYAQFEKIKQLNKVKGEPVQEEKYEMVGLSLPPFLPENFLYQGKISLKNKGESIWGEKPFQLKKTRSIIKVSDLNLPEGVLVKPGQTFTFNYYLQTLSEEGEFSFSWEDLPEHKVRVIRPIPLLNEENSIFTLLFQKIFSFWLK